MIADVDNVCSLIASHRFHYHDEERLHSGIEAVLTRNAIPFERERIIGLNRPDFFLPGPDIAIEVKIKNSLADLTRQVYRYAKCSEVKAVLVVTDKMRLSNLPDEMLGKPVRVVTLIGGFA